MRLSTCLADERASEPRAFGVCTPIVFVHPNTTLPARESRFYPRPSKGESMRLDEFIEGFDRDEAAERRGRTPR